MRMYCVHGYKIANSTLEFSIFELLKDIGSSEEVHAVDALAITGEEGRGSLRKASGS